ncbi:putative zinc finger protein At1g68190 isoform X3 [Herrania umbratica]|uniref:Zinc finger protein At1g68190 isoform X3 n=1 Tax=Herrania umbratica TaxID=108875 RepID=A0A6J1BIK5_9ROSI|nr:putative zinc finger protein At1g68190 isoform X3 [Herrania umbratica]
MEKICEFCTTSGPVVYCKADAAHLCLSCDAKVHSANALSNRHLRTLLCDSCRYRPSYVRCLDHQMFLCRGCDRTFHGASSRHQRRAVSSYLGCPSAKDFAALWGFELNELENNAIQDQSLSNSCVSVNPDVVKLDDLGQSCSQIGVSSSKSCVTLAPAAGCNVGSNSQQTKLWLCMHVDVFRDNLEFILNMMSAICSKLIVSLLLQVINKGQQQQNTSFILQQILDLKKLQLTERDSHLPSIGGQEQAVTSSSKCNFSQNLDSNRVHDIGINLHQSNNPIQEQNADPLPLSFSHLENLASSSTSGIPLYGESFWQCKSPIHGSQLWSQNMQDLGVCEDIFCEDDFNMPDMELTFPNFEDLFGADQDPIRALLDDKDVSCSSVDKDMSFNKSDIGNARPVKGISDSPRPIRPSYSTMSFSVSRFSAESSGTDCPDSGLSPITQVEASYFSPDLDSLHSEARENAMLRYKEKKKARLHERQIRSASRKARTDVRKRVKGRFPKMEDYDSDNANGTRSY